MVLTDRWLQSNRRYLIKKNCNYKENKENSLDIKKKLVKESINFIKDELYQERETQLLMRKAALLWIGAATAITRVVWRVHRDRGLKRIYRTGHCGENEYVARQRNIRVQVGTCLSGTVSATNCTRTTQ
jgi:hypothetical protein